MEIRSADGRVAVLFETEATKAKHTMRTSELVFDKLGDTYFPSRVFLAGDRSGNELAKTKMQGNSKRVDRKLRTNPLKDPAYKSKRQSRQKQRRIRPSR